MVGVLIETATAREDNKGNLGIAEDGQFISFLEQTIPPLAEGDLAVSRVLDPLDLDLPPPYFPLPQGVLARLAREHHGFSLNYPAQRPPKTKSRNETTEIQRSEANDNQTLGSGEIKKNFQGNLAEALPYIFGYRSRLSSAVGTQQEQMQKMEGRKGYL